MTIRNIQWHIQPNETKEEYVDIDLNMNALSLIANLSKEQIDKIWLYIKGYLSCYLQKTIY